MAFPYAHIRNFDHIISLYHSLLSSSLYFSHYTTLTLCHLENYILSFPYITCVEENIYFFLCELLILFYLIKLNPIHLPSSDIISFFFSHYVYLFVYEDLYIGTCVPQHSYGGHSRLSPPTMLVLGICYRLSVLAARTFT